MKCLKVEGRRGLFNRKGEFLPLDQITKEDILDLLDIATNPDEPFEMDSLEDNPIDNEAHSIIYKSLYSKFTDLLNNRTRFHDESANVYKAALEKYSE